MNHRGLDLHFQQSSEFSPFEAAQRASLKERIGRGHLEIRVSLVRDAGPQGVACDWEALKGYVETFRRARKELRLGSGARSQHPARVAGSSGRRARNQRARSAFQAALLAALGNCIDQLNESREREGRELVAGLVRELADIERATAEIQQLRTEALAYTIKSCAKN